MQQKIEALIQEESDPRERARLLVLYEIARVLIDNVAAQRETTEEFRAHRLEYDAHVKREEAFLNQGRGVWRVVAWVFALVQGVLGYYHYEHKQEMRATQVTLTHLVKEAEVTRERHRIEDRLGRQP